MTNSTCRNIAAALLLGLWPAAAQALPEDPGPYKQQKLTRSQTLAGKLVSFDLYLPQVSAPAPVVALAHGFARTRAQMAGWGKLLASRGYVALAPDLPGPMPDHTLNGKLLVALLDWAVAQSKTAGAPLAGRVDGARRGVMGHSAGGLAALLAAVGDPRIKVVVGLDPVDANKLAQQAAPKIKVPVTITRAEPGACNSNGNAAAIYSALAGPRLTLKVIKGTHCDPEWHSGALCSLACGATDAKRQARFRRYAMATLDHVLRCSSTARLWLGGASAKADALITALAAKGFPPKQLGCASSPDAGPPDARPPAADATPPANDLAATQDAQASPDTAAKPAASDNGCSLARPAPATGVPWVGALLLGVALAWRRRRAPTVRRRRTTA